MLNLQAAIYLALPTIALSFSVQYITNHITDTCVRESHRISFDLKLFKVCYSSTKDSSV